MEVTQEEKPFKIHGIDIISFFIQQKDASEDGKDTFEFKIQQEQKTNAKKGLIIVFTTVSIREEGKDILLAKLQLACGFEVPFFDSLIKKNKEGALVIPHKLSVSVSRIAVATTRGVLYSQLRGSFLQNSTLPILPIE